jgi:hypothetical protein
VQNSNYPGYTLSRFDGKCPCGILTDDNLGYSEYYDEFYCRVCNNWLAPPCGDPKCEDCANRPKHPIRPPMTPEQRVEWIRDILEQCCGHERLLAFNAGKPVRMQKNDNTVVDIYPDGREVIIYLTAKPLHRRCNLLRK